MPITINVLSSKSISNRALILAILKPKSAKTMIFDVLKCDDTKVMLEAYKALKVDFKIKNENEKKFDIEVVSGINTDSAEIFCNNAGTATRFLIACIGLFKGVFTFDGDKRMRERPISDLITSLRELGVKIEYLGQDGFLPLKIYSKGSLSGSCKINSNISSQFLSGLMLANSVCKDFSYTTSSQTVSRPYIDLTKDVIEKMMATDSFKIEADMSSATYWFCLGALLKSGISVKNANMESLQPDIKILDAITKMGGVVEKDKRQGVLVKKGETLNELSLYNCEDFPDGAMTLAVLCVFAKNKSKLTGLSTLQYKECNRLEALKNEFSKLGIDCHTGSDFIQINPSNDFKNKSVELETYNDHRMAMCLSLFAFFNPKITILNPSCVNKTYPTYWQDFEYALRFKK